MKKILIVSECARRRDTLGIIGGILSVFSRLCKEKYHISLLYSNFFESYRNSKDYPVDCFYCLDKSILDGVIRRIPRIRSVWAEKKAIETFKKIISTNQFDVVLVFQIPNYADKIVSMAHANGMKVLFVPLGSDILQVSNTGKERRKRAFAEVDAVIGGAKTNTLIAAQEIYNVPKDRIIEQKEALMGVVRLKSLKGKLTREEMHKEVGVPFSNYNIVCGYSGRRTHRHSEIVDALIKVKDVLPKGYQIIFPMTYGAGAHHEIIINYAAELKDMCDKAGLNTLFMTDFKTNEQMAYLHLITDMFIEIQPTDNGNAFMIEALYAQNQIITGRWLNYKRFEQFGEPYYLIDSPEELPLMLRKIFTKQVAKKIIPQQLIDFYDVPEGYSSTGFWANVFDMF